MPMGLFGPLTGTNNAVCSGAHFGVRGRVLGSFLSLLTAIAFYSISVWVSGDAFVGALVRLFGIDDSDLLRGVVYAVIGALVIVVVVYGYLFMLLVNKVVVFGNTVLMLLGVVAYAGPFDAGYDPGPAAYALGGFWPTFVLSALIVMGNPVSFGAFLGDWSRYIPAGTSPPPSARRDLPRPAAPRSCRSCSASPPRRSSPARRTTSWRSSRPRRSGTRCCSWSSRSSAGCPPASPRSTAPGLDFSSVFPRLSRVQASLFIGALAFVFILVGRLAFDLIASVNAFIGAIVICTTPWMVIMTIGYVVRRGYYRPPTCRCSTRAAPVAATGSPAGVNWRGMVAWIPAAVVGLLFANYPPLIEGPFRNAAGGVDLSLPVAIGLAAVHLRGALFVAPEPRYVFGPDGPRWVPAAEGAAPEVVDDAAAPSAAHRARGRPAEATGALSVPSLLVC